MIRGLKTSVALVAVLFSGCGGNRTDAESIGKPEGKSEVLSMDGDWLVRSKSCQDGEVHAAGLEKLAIPKGGGLIGFYSTLEEDAEHLCGQYEVYKFILSSAQHESDSSGSGVNTQSGVLQPFKLRTACFRKKGPQREKVSDVTTDFAGVTWEARLEQIALSKLTLMSSQSPYCGAKPLKILLDRLDGLRD